MIFCLIISFHQFFNNKLLICTKAIFYIIEPNNLLQDSSNSLAAFAFWKKKVLRRSFEINPYSCFKIFWFNLKIILCWFFFTSSPLILLLAQHRERCRLAWRWGDVSHSLCFVSTQLLLFFFLLTYFFFFSYKILNCFFFFCLLFLYTFYFFKRTTFIEIKNSESRWKKTWRLVKMQ